MTPILYRYTSDNAETWKEDAERYAECASQAHDGGLLPQLTEPYKSGISKFIMSGDVPICRIKMFRDRNGLQCVVDASQPKPKK